jgi:HTH-type transcriptional regulator/antitoxin HigA
MFKRYGRRLPPPGNGMSTAKNRKATGTTKSNALKPTAAIQTAKRAQAASVSLTEPEYKACMQRIEKLMLKGSEHLGENELSELRTLSLLAQGYEQQHSALELPTTFAGILERKMYEMKLKQGELARRLNVSPAKLSLVISGKQKPDVALVKAAYEELQLDGNLLLRAL